MTIEEINANMLIGVMRTDILVGGTYHHFINEAQRAICTLRSWQFMKDEADVTLVAGALTAALPADFKELAGKSPIYLVQDGNQQPVDVWTLAKHRRRGTSVFSTHLVAHLDDTTTPPHLDFHRPIDSDATFGVRYYKFLADLTTGTNTLLTKHPYMVIHKAKALAFATVNDPIAQEFEGLFYLEFKRAAAADAYAQLAGTDLHM